MKVRVKLAGTARTVDVGDIQKCTLSDLQQKTADVFELGDTSFSLSLNKKDALSGEDLPLSQLGIVPGDLVFILCPDLSSNNSSSVTPSPSTSVNNCGNGTVPHGTGTADCGSLSQESGAVGAEKKEEASQVVESTSQTSWQENSHDQETSGLSDEGGPPSCSAERDSPSPCPLEDPEVNRCLQEPLLCRESTPTSVPALLRDVFSAAACGTAADALWVVLHTLMLEVGFRPVQEGDICLGAGWNKRGFYKQDYCHLCVHTQHSCSLIGVPMGQVVVVHGVTNGDPPLKTDPQSLKVGDYVQQTADMAGDVCGVYSNLERLSRVVKDQVCHPLMGQLSEVCGFAVSVGLLSLSYEVQLKVLSYLPPGAVTKVGQVCRSLNAVYKDPCVWRRLYLREFGQKEDNSLNKNWYQLYKEALQLRKERRRFSRHRQQMMMSIPPWLHPPHGHFSPFPPSGFHGGVIGGDYDLNPDFASSIPHPLGGQPRHPNPFLPQGPGLPGGPFMPRPRFDDPFGPDAGPHFMALGARATRSSASTFNRSLGGHRFM